MRSVASNTRADTARPVIGSVASNTRADTARSVLRSVASNTRTDTTNPVLRSVASNTSKRRVQLELLFVLRKKNEKNEKTWRQSHDARGIC